MSVHIRLISMIHLKQAKPGRLGFLGFAYSDINAIIGKDESGVGSGELGVGHLDGRLGS